MKKSVLCLILPFLIVFISALTGEIFEYENQPIQKVEILTHSQKGILVDNHSISSRLSTHVGGQFSQTDFDEDLKLLAQDYDRIDPSIETSEEGISITIHVWPKLRIRSICWQGNHLIKTSVLEKELNIHCFALFEKQAFNQAFHKLKAYYIKQGFFEAQLDYRIDTNCETNEIMITITIQEVRSGKIQEIVLVNFCEKEESDILREMITKKYNLFTSWYTQAGTYNEDAIQQDQLVITNYLQNQGYADAQVNIEVSESCKTNRIVVTITADKGERYTFGRLSFEGNHLLDDCTIDRLFTIREGYAFSLENLKKTIEAITNEYGQIGYINAIVDFNPELIESTYSYNVHFKIEEGEQFRVGLIRIFGNVRTESEVIRHETLLIPGEIFNVRKLEASEIRLRNVGYFKNVNVYIVKDTESSVLEGNSRDVYIEVEETGTGQFSAFVGFSTVEEIFGGITITERNFNSKNLYRSFREGLEVLRGGGEYLNLTAQIGQKSRNYVFSWTKPHFRDTKWAVGFDLSNSSTRYISNHYDLNTSALALHAHYDINPFLRFGVQYRIKNGIVDLHHHGKRISELDHDAHIHGLISAVGTSLSYDSTNHPVKPSRGLRSKLSIEYAGLGGDHQFFNIGYFNSYYFPVGSRSIIRYRADLRFIQPVGNTHYSSLPLDERIFLGGDYIVRGFRPYRLGPHYKHHQDTPRGGLSLQYYSVEMNRRIIEDLEVFIFIDAGHLSAKTWDFGRMSVSIGYGARFKLIDSIPPVTIGMGYPLNAHGRSDVKNFFFSFGGNF
jgi:outer membrane protein insertion porin family